MNDPFALWGCGNGYIRHLHPSVRLIGGAFLLFALFIAPMQRIPAFSICISATITWCLLAGMPCNMVKKITIAATLFFLPFLLLAPWIAIDHTATHPFVEKCITAGLIAVRGICSLFITAATIASLPLVDTLKGLSPLPMPGVVKVLLLQLINQTSLLAAETLRIITVMKMRSAAGRNGMNVLFSFPIVWMGRTLFRAERIAAAMTIRGYGVEAVQCEQHSLDRKDRIALILVYLVVLASIITRLKEWI